MNSIAPKENLSNVAVAPQDKLDEGAKKGAPKKTRRMEDRLQARTSKSVSVEGSETAWLRNRNHDQQKGLSDTLWIRNSFRKKKKDATPKSKRRPLPIVDGKVKVLKKDLSSLALAERGAIPNTIVEDQLDNSPALVEEDAAARNIGGHGRKSVSFECETETTWLRNSNHDRKSIKDTAWIRNSFRNKKKETEKEAAPIIDTDTLEDSINLEVILEADDVSALTPRHKSVSFECETETTWLRNSNHDNRRSIKDTAWIRNSFRKKKPVKQDILVSPNSSCNRSVSFATGASFDDGERSPSRRGRGNSRLSQVKARLRGSVKTSVGDMDASWGGSLMTDLSMSSSEYSDEDSLGDFALDSRTNFRAKAQQSISFNMSFMQLGEEQPAPPCNRSDASNRRRSQHTGRKHTGRGSIFVIADPKFAQTKVVQRRLEKAATKLQLFFRRCLLILRHYSDEREYLQSEFKDIESRRLEELADVKRFIEEEKEQVRLELEQEWNANKLSPEEWESFNKEMEDTKEEIASIKIKNEQLKKDCKELQHENNQLSIVEVWRRKCIRSKEMQVQKLEQDNTELSSVSNTYEKAIDKAKCKLDEIAESRKVKRAHRKRIEKTITKVVKLLESSQQAEENTKLVEKVHKLKIKGEKKLKKLKAKTAQSLSANIEEKEEGQQLQRKEKCKSSRSKDRRRSKKQPKDEDPAQDPAADKGTKKKKKKDKRKGKESKTDKESTTAVDESASALMKMYEADQKKKASDNGGGESPKSIERVEDEPVQPGALMEIILGK